MPRHPSDWRYHDLVAAVQALSKTSTGKPSDHSDRIRLATARFRADDDSVMRVLGSGVSLSNNDGGLLQMFKVPIAVLVLILTAGVAGVSASSATPAPPSDTLGLVDTSSGVWHLYEEGDEVVTFTYGNPGDQPFMGDWDCDGVDTPGLYRQADGFVYLRNTNTTGIADLSFIFGDQGDIAVAGDFNADGCDTVSIYRPAEARFYVANELGNGGNGLGAADLSFLFGDIGDSPFVGDFNGDGRDTVGVHRTSTGSVYLRNVNSEGVADAEFLFGDPGDRIVVGDWNGDAIDTAGVYRPRDGVFHMRWTNTEGAADVSWKVGDPSWIPVAGSFTPPITPTTTTTTMPPPTTSTTTTTVPPPDPVTITLAGDTGAGTAATATLNLVPNIAPDAHFAVGDLSYGDLEPESAWCTYVKDIVGWSQPFQLIAGNHEDDGPDGYIRNFTACLPDKLNATGDYGVNYYTDIGGLVRVVAISPDLTIDGVSYGYEPGSPERDWLQTTVTDARNKGLWVVLAHHKVCISSAEKVCEIGEELADWEATNVDVVVMGHAHSYQRSHQLSCVDIDTVTAGCIEDTDGTHTQGAGAVFVIVGVAGRDRPVNRSDPEFGYFAALMGTGDPEWGHGLVRLDITQDRIEADFVGGDTSYTDSFTLTR